MLTFMLTCDYLCLPYHAVPRPDPTAILTQSWCEASGCGSGVGWTPRPKVWWRSQVKPWRIVWQCEWKKIRASFQAQIPYKLQVIVKKTTSKSRGFLRPDHFGEWISSFAVAKTTFFSKRSKRWRGFPRRDVLLCLIYGLHLFVHVFMLCIVILYLCMFLFIMLFTWCMFTCIHLLIRVIYWFVYLFIIYIYATAKIQDLVCPKMGNAGYSSAVPDTSPWHLCGRPSRSSGFL